MLPSGGPNHSKRKGTETATGDEDSENQLENMRRKKIPAKGVLLKTKKRKEMLAKKILGIKKRQGKGENRPRGG